MYLMSKDIKILYFDFNTLQFKVLVPELLPFAIRGKEVNLFTLYNWLLNRVLSLSRSNAKTLLSALHLDQNDKLNICFYCHALSLTDCFWTQEDNSNLKWKDINLYSNSLNKAVAEVALIGKYISIQGKVRTPELTGDGSYAKCWRRLKDGLYLYKSGSLQGNGKEYLIDILCSDILDRLHVDHVKYTEAQTGLIKVSRCKNMTDLSRSICEMDYFSGYCNRNNLNLNKFLEAQTNYFNMFVVDYIIANTDRHSANWGVYFNADTGKVIRLHPLYDHNISLAHTEDIMSKVIMGKTREECAKMFKYRAKVNIFELKSWLKTKEAKNRFERIFGKNCIEYKEINQRVNKYILF